MSNLSDGDSGPGSGPGDVDLDAAIDGDTSADRGSDSDADEQADSGTAADADAGTDTDADTQGGSGFVLETPSDGEHFFQGEPVVFAGTTPGKLEVFADGNWPLGGEDTVGPFSFEYAFNGLGARPVSFVVDGASVLEILLNIDPANRAKVCLCPGHPSSVGDKLYEGIINRKVAFYLEELLVGAGYDVFSVVDDISKEEMFEPGFNNEGAYEQSLLDVVTLAERVGICNDWPADYFISIHHNAVADTFVNYTLTLYGEASAGMPYSETTVSWADYTTGYLDDVMNVTAGYTRGDRSFLGFGLYVIQNTEMPAILTEGSFYSNAAERILLNQNDYLEGEAGAIYDGFETFMDAL